ncbi:MAG: hypothetical protein KGL39_56245 [Patescibacteria group bacterium]|nr:hypothetical protein [Patescibacteria group bacterium]
MNTAQKLALTIGILGFVAAGGTQLTDIFSPFGSIAPLIVKEIVSLAGFVSGILGVVLTFTTGQGAQIKSVLAMPGVDSLNVNEKANRTLAAIAIDPAQPKIQATPQAEKVVQETAAAAS